MDSFDVGRGVACLTVVGVATRVAISNGFAGLVLIEEGLGGLRSLAFVACCAGAFGVFMTGDGTGFKIFGDVCGMTGVSFFIRSALEGD